MELEKFCEEFCSHLKFANSENPDTIQNIQRIYGEIDGKNIETPEEIKRLALT